MRNAWTLLKQTIAAYSDDEALSRGAAIAFYTVTSLAPVLVIIIAVAGLAFGHDAAQGAIVGQLRGLMGKQSAEMMQTAISSASGKSAGIIATVIGGLTLLATASGVFGEMQNSLNAIWKAKPEGGTVSTMVKARAASLGLVVTLGFLLMVSLVASAGISALSGFIDVYIPFGHVLMIGVNFIISFALITALFAAIYKVLPDKHLEWRDVITGAVVTSLLFTIGKTAIGLYLGSSSVASSYGAAGGLIIALLWIYYSAQIFLLGAEFTKVYAVTHGSHQGSAIDDPQHHTAQQAPPAAAKLGLATPGSLKPGSGAPASPVSLATVAMAVVLLVDVLRPHKRAKQA